MKQRPILFSTPMVQAILEGRKTQTRRIVNPQELSHTRWRYCGHSKDGEHEVPRPVDGPRPHDRWYWWRNNISHDWILQCPYGEPGDILWVRETWQHAKSTHCHCPQSSEPSPCDEWSNGIGCRSNRGKVVYAADGASEVLWKPSIHMPKEACRLFLRIKSVRVERLQDISEQDAIAEGVQYWADDHDTELLDATFRNYKTGERNLVTSYSSFQSLWQKINGDESWGSNPWVWVIEFERIEKPAA